MLGLQRSNLGEQPRPLFTSVLKKVFVEDWMLKLTALVITLALWFGITGLSTPITKRFTIPLVPSLAPNAEITNVLISEVHIVVSGDKRKVDQINPSDLMATLDLTDVPPGDRVISLTPESVGVTLPQGVRLMEVQPILIPVNLEAVEEKDVEVRVVLSGDPAPGTEVYSATVLPPRIRVRGPASYIRPLDHIEAGPVDITSRARDFTARQIPVGVSNPKASVYNTVVDVIFRIGEKRIERSFAVPLSSFSVPIAGLQGKTAYFTLYGPRSLITEASSVDMRIEMSESEGGQPRVILPPELADQVEIRKLTVR